MEVVALGEAATGAEIAGGLLEVTGPLRRALRRAVRRQLPGDALSPAQSEVLALLERQPGLAVGEAAGVLRLAPNTVSTLVNQLARGGLVRRERHADDRRSVRLWPTRAASGVLDARRTVRREAVVAALAELGPEDHRRIAEALPALGRLVARLEEEEA